MEALLVTTNELGIEVNAERSERMFISCQQNVGKECNLKINDDIV